MSEPCPECGVVLSDPAARESHGRLVHEGGWIVDGVAVEAGPTGEERTCPLCSQPLPSKESLARHSIRPHYRSNRSVRRATPPVG
jgi:hypothetical protein